MRTEEVNCGHQHQPGKHATGEDRAGNARADDVANPEVLRRGIGADGRAGQPFGLVIRSAGPRAEQVAVLKQGIDRTQTEAPENAAGKGAAVFAGEQNVGAGGAFRIGEMAVFLDDEFSSQRNHEEDAEPSAEQREKKDAGVFQIEAEKDERGQGEDDAGGNRLAGVAGGLDNVIFEDRGAAESTQHTDRQHGDWNGGSNGEPGAKADVDSDGAEKDAEDAAEKNGAESKFRTRFFRLHIGLKFRGR